MEDTTAQRPASRWATAAGLGQAHWFFGNLYEAVVDVPGLLADSPEHGPKGPLDARSPLRYYAPVAPVTLAATAVTVVRGWRAGNRPAAVTAAASTAAAMGLTGFMVRTVILPMFRGDLPADDAERRARIRIWHRANVARMAAVAVATVAVRRAAR